MKRSSPVYRLYLVPVDDDGTISASFLEEAKGAAPRVSKEQPVDLTAARALVLSELPVIQGVCRRLGNLAEVLHSGARNFCVVRAVTRRPDPETAIRELHEIWRQETGTGSQI